MEVGQIEQVDPGDWETRGAAPKVLAAAVTGTMSV